MDGHTNHQQESDLPRHHWSPVPITEGHCAYCSKTWSLAATYNHPNGHQQTRAFYYLAPFSWSSTIHFVNQALSSACVRSSFYKEVKSVFYEQLMWSQRQVSHHGKRKPWSLTKNTPKVGGARLRMRTELMLVYHVMADGCCWQGKPSMIRHGSGRVVLYAVAVYVVTYLHLLLNNLSM